MKIFFFALLLASCARPNGPRSLDSLAQCLSAKGVTLYGAKWCGACKRQEEALGAAYSKIKHVQCDRPGEPGQDPGCSEPGGGWCYPTWEFPGGKRICGVMTPEELAKESGCTY